MANLKGGSVIFLSFTLFYVVSLNVLIEHASLSNTELSQEQISHIEYAVVVQEEDETVRLQF